MKPQVVIVFGTELGTDSLQVFDERPESFDIARRSPTAHLRPGTILVQVVDQTDSRLDRNIELGVGIGQVNP